MLLSWSQCQEKKTILAASHCEAEEIERVAMFWQSKSILNRKKNVLAIKTNPAAKERVLVLSQKLTSVVNNVAVWQCGSVVNTHNEILTKHRHYRLVFVKTWYDLKYMI